MVCLKPPCSLAFLAAPLAVTATQATEGLRPPQPVLLRCKLACAAREKNVLLGLGPLEGYTPGPCCQTGAELPRRNGKVWQVLHLLLLPDKIKDKQMHSAKSLD